MLVILTKTNTVGDGSLDVNALLISVDHIVSINNPSSVLVTASEEIPHVRPSYSELASD